MHAQFAAVVVVGFLAAAQGSGAVQGGLKNLEGAWATTKAPAAGEAPMIAPTLTISIKEGHAYVATEGKEASPAVVFRMTDKESLLVVKRSGSRGTNETMIIRPQSGGRLQVEVFHEYPSRPGSNFVYSEAFKKAS